MHEKPKLQVTRDYGLFEMHDTNRTLHDDKVLLASLQKNGFSHADPIQVVRNGNGKLKVKKGHHRLSYAKRLGLPVWYIVADKDIDIFELEGGQSKWTAKDFVTARSAAGNAGCTRVIDFQKKHGLTLSAAASLIGGESAGSNNKVRAIKEGTFKASSDLSHAHAVVAITDFCRDHGVPFGTSAGFVAAVSMCVRVPEFDVARFRHRIKLHGFAMRKRSTREEYLEEIDALYNYGAKTARLPVAFKAKEVSRRRQETFGGKTNNKGHAKKH